MTDTTNRSRQAAGTSKGGQFAAEVKGESAGTLSWSAPERPSDSGKVETVLRGRDMSAAALRAAHADEPRPLRFRLGSFATAPKGTPRMPESHWRSRSASGLTEEQVTSSRLWLLKSTLHGVVPGLHTEPLERALRQGISESPDVWDEHVTASIAWSGTVRDAMPALGEFVGSYATQNIAEAALILTDARTGTRHIINLPGGAIRKRDPHEPAELDLGA